MTTRILLADDDEAVTSTLAPLLERSGFGVELARDGLEALRLTREHQPDLVIVDVRMPRADGREVCRRLRQAHDWTPVIMLTEFGLPAERAMSLEEGADDYVIQFTLTYFKPGDELVVEAAGAGRILLVRAEDLVDRHAGKAPGVYPPTTCASSATSGASGS